jgi:hypothetical protein
MSRIEGYRFGRVLVDALERIVGLVRRGRYTDR